MVDALNATALTGIRVLDLGQIYNGSYATMMMAMAGADVIKVEPLRGETLRGRGPASPSAFAFNFLNQNKRSITVISRIHEGWLCLSDLSQKHMGYWKTSLPTR